jgi:uncharacterized protein YkwD
MLKNKNKARKKKTARKSALNRWRVVMRRLKYAPAITIAILATFLAWTPHSLQSPTRDVLSYATNTSPSGLLAATNTQRSNNGVVALSSNSLLAQAAQTKSEDMVAKNYWAHVSPDGKQPWSFISAAGYSYISAGENLAYGFLTSGDTVTGWMNSPSHKANLLSTSFTEVGFGIANSADFVGDGPQTIVVAMYGSPQVAGAATTSPSQPVAKSAPKTSPAPATEPAPTPVIETPIEPVAENAEIEQIAVASTDNNTPNSATPANIPRIQLLTGGAAVWSAVAVAALVTSIGIIWLIHHGIKLKRYFVAGERFVLQHTHLDLTVLAVIYMGFVLLSTSGVVR